MSYAERHVIAVQTSSGGAATEYSPVITGRIINVIYTKDGSTPYEDTVDFTITLEGTGQNLWTEDNITASEIIAPRQPTHNASGDASFYIAAGEAVEDYIVAAKDRVKIVIANGGDTLDGQFTIIVE